MTQIGSRLRDERLRIGPARMSLRPWAVSRGARSRRTSRMSALRRVLSAGRSRDRCRYRLRADRRTVHGRRTGVGGRRPRRGRSRRAGDVPAAQRRRQGIAARVSPVASARARWCRRRRRDARSACRRIAVRHSISARRKRRTRDGRGRTAEVRARGEATEEISGRAAGARAAAHAGSALHAATRCDPGRSACGGAGGHPFPFPRFHGGALSAPRKRIG